MVEWKADIRDSAINACQNSAMTDLLPLADISPAMADLVSVRGWSLIQCEGQLGYNAHASIEKAGVILRYRSVKGESDYGVALASPVHPPVDPELYRRPTLITVLKETGIDWAGTSNVFLVADLNLPHIKAYLSDAAVWERDIEAAVAAMADKYDRWINGPEVTRNVAQSLAERHPWLTNGKVPTPADFRKRAKRLSPKEALPLRPVLAAAGIGVIIAHYFA